MNILYVLFWFALFIVVLPMIAVAIGVIYRKACGIVQFTEHIYPYAMYIKYDVPAWLKWFSNPEDGLIGDSRGWYWNTYFPVWVPAWFKMWWWSAIRNPWNYLKRFVIGINIRKFTFHKLCGQDYVRDDLMHCGFQILYAKPKKGWFPRPMLYWVRRWGSSDRAIVVQVGWKIKLSHDGLIEKDEWDYFKGITFEPNFYKDIS